MPSLTTEKQASVVRALVEGCSIRSTERLTGVHRNTISKLILRLGKACDRIMEEQVRHVSCEQLELDEVWPSSARSALTSANDDDPKKVGDFWTWVGLDPDTKLVPAYFVGKRTMFDAKDFARLLRQRVEGRVQLNTDKLMAYRSAILGEFSVQREDGTWDRPDWGSIVKRFKVEPSAFGRYSPPKGCGRRQESGVGQP